MYEIVAWTVIGNCEVVYRGSLHEDILEGKSSAQPKAFGDLFWVVTGKVTDEYKKPSKRYLYCAMRKI